MKATVMEMAMDICNHKKVVATMTRHQPNMATVMEMAMDICNHKKVVATMTRHQPNMATVMEILHHLCWWMLRLSCFHHCLRFRFHHQIL